MKTIVVIVGVRGSGKSTLQSAAKQIPGVKLLLPSTSRAKRAGDNGQYHYEEKSSWDKNDFAWTIEINHVFYGLKNSELNAIGSEEIGLTVFHPGSIAELHKFRNSSPLEFVTVGIDTVESYPVLKQRIKFDSSRDEGEAAFNLQVKVVRECDAVLRGDAETIYNATFSIFCTLKSRAVLDKVCIANLIKAGCLLNDAELTNIQPASYDLTLGDTFWCKGSKTKLTVGDIIKIPAYSYVIVQAHQRACLPKFVVAQYDLKVSLFVQGIILSNGPQVDPGYKGALLCMLFNSSDNEVPLKRGGHFATIEFLTTNRVTEGYTDHHQNQNTLEVFMHEFAQASSGGTILERVDSMRKEWRDFRNAVLVPCVLAFFACAFVVAFWAHDITERANDSVAKAILAQNQAEIAESNLTAVLNGYGISSNTANATVNGAAKRSAK